MSNEHNEQSEMMKVTSALTGDTIRIDPREINALAVSYHSNELGFIRMESGKTWIVKERLATLAAIYADAMEDLKCN